MVLGAVLSGTILGIGCAAVAVLALAQPLWVGLVLWSVIGSVATVGSLLAAVPTIAPDPETRRATA
ncbi:MAG: hypothetical protein H6895_05980 [Defluviimonas sp.]|uniref:hypothetical protein n=1 Tax=Albidovulum sp. TaxID=1872424 RepID=UPI002A333871|nr:hypothetical protein [Defluviimonas sp.]